MSYQTGVGQRTAVVTGAAAPRGIGYATARRYAREGWAVALLDIDQNGIAASNQRLRDESDVPSIGLAVDVTDPDSIKRAVAEIAEAGLPPVGAVANIAGLASPVPFLDVDLALWQKVLDVNLTGTFLMCQAFLPQMIDNRYGRIVNMSSVSAQQGGGVFSKTPYSAAKAGILGLTRSLAREMAEHGITVNAVSPGVVATDIRAGATDEENEARLAAAVPLKRQATVDDIAALFVWLSSEDSSYITGGTHNINGGSYIA
ncbi:MAG: 2-hydroxycyclohexanecarboxyl-CoA dehydrogenase [Propionibacteriaceae bacterium]|jgi:2-hydroxycyclohexanecarboxyl-CoA dehydrogenase|nr:family NAD(P)-dependent oxidoreductase [Propionibacteriaceae bacterium]MDX6321235.1 2-hydroxycyclohexanecarboxyl-CoA dehydrogenase [Propionibacteriaceae bacterium]